MSETEKILPCPFCGGGASLWSKYTNSYFGYGLYVKCDRCGVMTRFFNIGNKLPDNWGNTDVAEEARKEWNKRFDGTEENHG